MSVAYWEVETCMYVCVYVAYQEVEMCMYV